MAKNVPRKGKLAALRGAREKAAEQEAPETAETGADASTAGGADADETQAPRRPRRRRTARPGGGRVPAHPATGEGNPTSRNRGGRRAGRASRGRGAGPGGNIVGHIKVFSSEEKQDRVYVLDGKDVFYVGRSSEAEVPLPDLKVSRKHCKIERKGGRYRVIDLGSRNATLVNGKRIRMKLLEDGDQIKIGFTVLQFFLAEKGAHVVEKTKKQVCELCGQPVDQADLISGKAEEVNGSIFCPDCVDKVTGEEEPVARTPAELMPPTGAEPTPAKKSVDEALKEAKRALDEEGTRAARREVKRIEAMRTVRMEGATEEPAEEPAEEPMEEPPRQPTAEREQKMEEVYDFMSLGDVPRPEETDEGEVAPMPRAGEETVYDTDADSIDVMSEPPPQRTESLKEFEDAELDNLLRDILDEE